VFLPVRAGARRVAPQLTRLVKTRDALRRKQAQGQRLGKITLSPTQFPNAAPSNHTLIVAE